MKSLELSINIDRLQEKLDTLDRASRIKMSVKEIKDMINLNKYLLEKENAGSVNFCDSSYSCDPSLSNQCDCKFYKPGTIRDLTSKKNNPIECKFSKYPGTYDNCCTNSKAIIENCENTIKELKEEG